MTELNRKAEIRALLQTLFARLGYDNDDHANITEDMKVGPRIATLHWRYCQDEQPTVRPVEPYGGATSIEEPDWQETLTATTATDDMRGCRLDILVHLRTSDNRCWSDIITAVAARGYSERTVATWLKKMVKDGVLQSGGRGKPYRIA